jgi:hypothetical protein
MNTITSIVGGESFQKSLPEGLFGVEIEMEGVSFRNLEEIIGQGWDLHSDNSLINGVEAVFQGPCSFDESIKRIDLLNAALNAKQIEPTFSIRTSVHVHMNCRDISPEHFFNLVFLYWFFEDTLSDWCGEDRKGNMFCLRRRDASYIEEVVNTSLTSNNLRHLFNHGDLKYSAINFMPLSRYGSVEFRLMKGTRSPVILKRWLSILNSLRNAAMSYNSPIDILQDVSEMGPERFAEKALGNREKGRLAVKCQHDMMRNMREIQYLMYARDWSKTDWSPVKKERVKKITIDPFEGTSP